ncbi:MAG: hypothetical protein GY795_39770 [Desulfobacterales bacterium]|nr:hypothetical protein [Desulfobacterales bacterium]
MGENFTDNFVEQFQYAIEHKSFPKLITKALDRTPVFDTILKKICLIEDKLDLVLESKTEEKLPENGKIRKLFAKIK